MLESASVDRKSLYECLARGDDLPHGHQGGLPLPGTGLPSERGHLGITVGPRPSWRSARRRHQAGVGGHQDRWRSGDGSRRGGERRGPGQRRGRIGEVERLHVDPGLGGGDPTLLVEQEVSGNQLVTFAPGQRRAADPRILARFTPRHELTPVVNVGTVGLEIDQLLEPDGQVSRHPFGRRRRFVAGHLEQLIGLALELARADEIPGSRRDEHRRGGEPDCPAGVEAFHRAPQA